MSNEAPAPQSSAGSGSDAQSSPPSSGKKSRRKPKAGDIVNLRVARNGTDQRVVVAAKLEKLGKDAAELTFAFGGRTRTAKATEIDPSDRKALGWWPSASQEKED